MKNLSTEVLTFIKENPKVKSSEIANKFKLGSWQKVAAAKRRLTGREVKSGSTYEKIVKIAEKKGENVTIKYLAEKLGKKKTTISSSLYHHGYNLSTFNDMILSKKASKKQVNSFSNSDGVYKKQAREKMTEYIVKSGLTAGKILTLPFSTCKLELTINETINNNKFEYLGCEQEETTYYEMLQTIARERLNMNTYKGSISDKIYQSKEDQYSHLLLDYCGTLETFATEIKYAVDNNIVKKGGTISVTLCKRGSRKKGTISTLLESLPEGLFPEEKTVALGAKLFFSNLVSSEYKFEEFFEYQDINEETGTRKMPMMLIVIRRNL